jgi:hypothetical protein
MVMARVAPERGDVDVNRGDDDVGARVVVEADG